MAKTNHQKKPVQVTMPQPLDREEKNLKIKELIKLAKEQGYLDLRRRERYPAGEHLLA